MTPEDVWFPIFCDFCKPVISHPVYMVSHAADSGPAYDILNRADVFPAKISSESSLSKNRPAGLIARDRFFRD